MAVRRLTACVIGVLAFSMTARATAPAIVDPQSDLFERPSKQALPTPLDGRPAQTVAPKQGDAPPQQTVAPEAAEPPPLQAMPSSPPPPAAPERSAGPARTDMPMNPLWGIPLTRLTATRDRPLFSASRRPRAPPAAKPAVAVTLPPAPVEREKPPLSLVGTAVSSDGERLGLFVNIADKSTVRLKAGESYKGWMLRAVRARQVELGKGLESALLDLPRPDLREAAVPLAAGMAAPGLTQPMMSSANAVPPTSASGAIDASAAAGTGSGMASALPASPPGATIVVRPPMLHPAPAAANPFRNGRLP
ncbi:hypothetical protein ACQR0Z_21345 [Bradyrhizobium sp. HKCCYLS3077]|uniref:hypothetical protein n=1 Tax=Bradyrhizobium sp. HKCCYLS3077 TaxID=3420761 RepID=UPI003EB94AB5